MRCESHRSASCDAIYRNNNTPNSMRQDHQIIESVVINQQLVDRSINFNPSHNPDYSTVWDDRQVTQQLEGDLSISKRFIHSRFHSHSFAEWIWCHLLICHHRFQKRAFFNQSCSARACNRIIRNVFSWRWWRFIRWWLGLHRHRQCVLLWQVYELNYVEVVRYGTLRTVTFQSSAVIDWWLMIRFIHFNDDWLMINPSHFSHSSGICDTEHTLGRSYVHTVSTSSELFMCILLRTNSSRHNLSSLYGDSTVLRSYPKYHSL